MAIAQINEVDMSFARMVMAAETEAKERYEAYDTYYDGKQLVPLPTLLETALEEYGVVRNLCALVVNTYCSKLRVSSITSATAQDKVDLIAKLNHFPLVQSRVHKAGAKYGDSYVRLWPGEVVPSMQVLDPINVRPVYSQDGSQKMLWCKVEWLDVQGLVDGTATGDVQFFRRKDIYYPDHLERFVSTMNGGAGIWTTIDGIVTLDTGSWEPYLGDGEPDTIPYAWGRIPIIHFRNRPDEGDFGNSELLSALPIQIDKDRAEQELALRATFSAAGQIWVTGYNQLEYEAAWKGQHPFEAVPKLSRDPWTVWNFPSPTTQLGRIAPDDLTQFIAYCDKLTDDMANCTQTPVAYLKGQAVPSGVALQEIAGPLSDKVEEAQTTFGEAWEDMFNLACLMQSVTAEVTLEWKDAFKGDSFINDMAEYKAGLISKIRYHMRRGLDETEAATIVDEVDAEAKVKDEQDFALAQQASALNPMPPKVFPPTK